MRRLLAILIDGFRYDYLSEKDTPFLFSIAGSHPHAPVTSILGYSDACRATIFTGTCPNRHNYWTGYKYSPATSPFGAFRSYGFVDRLPSLTRPWAKLALSKVLQRLRGRRYDIRNIPIKVASFFDYTSAGELTSPWPFGDIPTVFDVLRESKVGFACIDSTKLGWRYFWFARSMRRKLVEAIGRLDSEAKFVYVYLHYLDNGAHRYGTCSPRFLGELRDVDSLVQDAVDTANCAHGETDILIFSDHGMTDATQFINFDCLINDQGFGNDYVLSLDSTMVRIWYLKKHAANRLKGQMAELDCGRFLTETDKRELNVDFAHSFYGDDIYLIHPPYNIFPNFISFLKPVAMHAYHPDLRSQQGIVIFKGKASRRLQPWAGPVGLVDLMPTFLEALGLTIPPTCQGKSLL